MTPSERLTQRLGVNAVNTAKQQPAPKRPAPSAGDTFRARLGVEKIAEPSGRASTVDPGRGSNPFITNVNTQALRDQTMGGAGRGPSTAAAAGKPADRLTARLAQPAPSQPGQGRPAPSPQQRQQQAPSGPAARLDARLASGGTEKIAAAMAQQKQRGPTPGRGM